MLNRINIEIKEEKNMENKLKLTIVYTPCEEGGYTAYIKEMRGVISEGETKQEARENVLDALGLMLEVDREESELEDSTTDKISDELIILV
jgi:predicted RNase H-like HicB family nuclease